MVIIDISTTALAWRRRNAAVTKQKGYVIVGNPTGPNEASSAPWQRVHSMPQKVARHADFHDMTQ